ncbi:MAG: hypothetical protein Q9214_004016 [Letrouitia sp. 1 TL-2023]
MISRSQTGFEEPGIDSTFGVRSLEETTSVAVPRQQWRQEEKRQNSDGESDHARRQRSTLSVHRIPLDPSKDCIEKLSSDREYGVKVADGRSHQQLSPLPSASQSSTSLSQASQAVGSSLPSSPKSTSSRSFRPSDEDSAYDGGSQAIASSEEEEGGPLSQDLGNTLQLIMPSINMPRRRPFTARGKDIGRFKVLVAGDSGVGKTSFIKSVVQSCEDIVYVDQLSPNSPAMAQLRSRMTTKNERLMFTATDQITEIWASTRAYPQWWLDMEESKVLRRRRSIGDFVLERNLCFVDTPGYSRALSITEGMNSVVAYVEQQFGQPFSSTNTSDSELVSLLSGNGGTQVDVVFYLIAQEFKAADLDFIQRLSQLTNVVPVVSKSDCMSSDDIQALKTSIAEELTASNVECFGLNPIQSTVSPFSICSTPSNDDDNMDASLLMSSDYIQPLQPSELSAVIEHLFEGANVARLRHLSARKLVRSRTAQQFIAQATCSPTLSLNSTLASSVPTTSVTAFSQTSTGMPMSPAMQEKFADYTQREGKLARLRLAKWAGDLQNSLRDERNKFEQLQHSERATWLSEKLAEHGRAGLCSPTLRSESSSPRRGSLLRSELGCTSTVVGLSGISDPLGLLRWNEALKRRGWMALQVVGSFGVLGAIAVWVTKGWGTGGELSPGWTWTWPGERI